MTTTTAETAAVEVETTTGETVVVEGEIVESHEGPQPNATEDNSSVVDGEAVEGSGEVAVRDAAPAKEVEKSDLSEAQAKRLTDRIKKAVTDTADRTTKLLDSVDSTTALMAEAYTKRIWIALGEETWEDYVNKELGEVRLKLDRAARQGLSYQLSSSAHMPTRAIAPILGVDQKTVSNDLRQVRRERGEDSAATVTAADGRTMQATQTRPRRQKPIEDRFDAALTKAEEFVNTLADISQEEGFAEAAGEVAKRQRRNLAQLADKIKAVQERIQ